MDRRKFITSLAAAGGTALGGSALGLPRDSKAAARRPNVIIILADDLGYGDLGCQGSRVMKTPRLDEMAEQGVRMTSFFASGPVCSPSRAGIMTGRYPIRSGVNYVFVPTELFPLALALYGKYRMPWGLPRNEIVLPELMKTAGYNTCCIGKWHLGDLPGQRPRARGFDYYYGVLHSNDAIPLRLYENERVVEPAPVDQDYLTQSYTEKAVSWIESNDDSPFFLYMAHTSPHVPLHASPEFRGTSEAGLYGDCVEEIDWSVGQVLDALDRRGMAEDTLVFFTSDNGPWFQGSAGGLRGRKDETFGGGMKVPAIARWPGVIPAHTVTDRMSMNFDLFTTSLAAAGLEAPSDRPIDGRDVLPMLKGEEQSPHRELYFYKGRELQAVLQDGWKYHRRHKGWATSFSGRQRGPMLFHLPDDPDESYNVIDLYPGKAKELREQMDAWEKCMAAGVPRY